MLAYSLQLATPAKVLLTAILGFVEPLSMHGHSLRQKTRLGRVKCTMEKCESCSGQRMTYVAVGRNMHGPQTLGPPAECTTPSHR